MDIYVGMNILVHVMPEQGWIHSPSIVFYLRLSYIHLFRMQVPEALNMLKKRGKKVLYVSNNATKHRSQYMEKFEKMKIDAHMDDVVSSAYGAASYFAKQHGKGAKVYACGTQVSVEASPSGSKQLVDCREMSIYPHVSSSLYPHVSSSFLTY